MPNIPFGNGGGLIQKPKGRTIARVSIEVDHTGQTVFQARNVNLIGVESPMHNLSLASLLAQIVSSILVVENNNVIQQMKAGGSNATFEEIDNKKSSEPPESAS